MEESPEVYHLLERTINPTWAVVIPTYRRLERLFVCLHCLLASIRNLNAGVEIVVMDNAPGGNLLGSLTRYLARSREKITVIYRHFPSTNQSGLRNDALTLMSQTVRNVMLLDSDIYLSQSTLSACDRFLAQEESVVAIAPPLASYLGGNHTTVRARVAGFVRSGGIGIVMPSSYDYEASQYHGEFLESLMLRGAFIVHRELLQTVFANRPWLTIFEVWQNVPFFLTLRELGFTFGYLLDLNAICLNDERQHRDTFRIRRHDWYAHTVKSIILLFYRNQLWRPEQQELNRRFLKKMAQVLEGYLLSPVAVSMPLMIQTARYLSMSAEEGRKNIAELLSEATDIRFRDALTLLLREQWKEIQLVHSRNLNQPM